MYNVNQFPYFVRQQPFLHKPHLIGAYYFGVYYLAAGKAEFLPVI